MLRNSCQYRLWCTCGNMVTEKFIDGQASPSSLQSNAHETNTAPSPFTSFLLSPFAILKKMTANEIDDADLPDPSLKNIIDQTTLQWVFVGKRNTKSPAPISHARFTTKGNSSPIILIYRRKRRSWEDDNFMLPGSAVSSVSKKGEFVYGMISELLLSCSLRNAKLCAYSSCIQLGSSCFNRSSAQSLGCFLPENRQRAYANQRL